MTSLSLTRFSAATKTATLITQIRGLFSTPTRSAHSSRAPRRLFPAPSWARYQRWNSSVRQISSGTPEGTRSGCDESCGLIPAR